MHKYLISMITCVIAMSVVTACGGVASNPTAPSFTPAGQEGQNQSGAQGEGGVPDLLGQLSGGGAQMGEQVIEGTFETLWPQGMEAMERGQVVNAAQFYMSALARNPQSADAALAYAISDILRDHRRYSVFLHSGVDKLFMNTPLFGIPEAFPNPFLAEDSYLLRLAALGFRTRELNPTVVYPIMGAVDTEVVFTPETMLALLGAEQPSVAPGEPSVAGIPGPGAGSGAGAPPAAGSPSPNPTDRTPTSPDRMGSSEPKPGEYKQGAGLTDPNQVQDPAGRTTGGLPTAGMPPASQWGIIPEREQPVSEDEWESWIREYREAADRDSADIVVSQSFYINLERLQVEIEEHIANLELVRPGVEVEGYSLSLPFNILDGENKMTLAFDVDDYNLILDYFKLLDAMIKYVMAYDHNVDLVMSTDRIEDRNSDTILSPDEYLPSAPFGTLAQPNQEAFGAMLPDFISALTTLDRDMQPLLDAAQQVQAGDIEKKEVFYLSSFHRNYVLIEAWTQLLRDIAENSTTGTTIKLANGPAIAEVVAVYDALFNSPVTDIRAVLPSFGMELREVIVDEEGNFSPDPTLGGFFSEGLTEPGVYTTVGRLSLVVYDDEMAKAVGASVTVGDKSGTVGENGIVTIDDVTLNELVGIPFSVQDSSGQEIGSGVVRTLYEVVPLFDLTRLRAIFTPMSSGYGPSGMATAGAAGMTQAGTPGTGVSPAPGAPAPTPGEGTEDQGNTETGQT